MNMAMLSRGLQTESIWPFQGSVHRETRTVFSYSRLRLLKVVKSQRRLPDSWVIQILHSPLMGNSWLLFEERRAGILRSMLFPLPEVNRSGLLLIIAAVEVWPGRGIAAK